MWSHECISCVCVGVGVGVHTCPWVMLGVPSFGTTFLYQLMCHLTCTSHISWGLQQYFVPFHLLIITLASSLCDSSPTGRTSSSYLYTSILPLCSRWENPSISSSWVLTLSNKPLLIGAIWLEKQGVYQNLDLECMVNFSPVIDDAIPACDGKFFG